MSQQVPEQVSPQGARSRGAIGKAFLVYLGTGSVVAAIIAYLVFGSMGC
jgi:hypothetical protein